MRAVPRIGSRLDRTLCTGAAVLVLTMALAACGGGAAEDEDPRVAADDAASSSPAAAAVAQAGMLELDGVQHPFRVFRCDLTGTLYEGMLLHGVNDGQGTDRLSLQVERVVEDGGHVSEGVFVSFGSLADGDNWAADRRRMPDGRWFADESGMEPADGPLIEISDDELRIEAELERETDGATRQGSIRVTCGA